MTEEEEAEEEPEKEEPEKEEAEEEQDDDKVLAAPIDSAGQVANGQVDAGPARRRQRPRPAGSRGQVANGKVPAGPARRRQRSRPTGSGNHVVKTTGKKPKCAPANLKTQEDKSSASAEAASLTDSGGLVILTIAPRVEYVDSDTWMKDPRLVGAGMAEQ